MQIISTIIGQLFQKRKQGEINCEKHVLQEKITKENFIGAVSVSVFHQTANVSI